MHNNEINVTEAKNRFTELVKRVEATTSTYFIFRSGHKAAVLISAEEYEGLLETLEVLKDRNLMKQIASSSTEFARGKGVPFTRIRRNV